MGRGTFIPERSSQSPLNDFLTSREGWGIMGFGVVNMRMRRKT